MATTSAHSKGTQLASLPTKLAAAPVERKKEIPVIHCLRLVYDAAKSAK